MRRGYEVEWTPPKNFIAIRDFATKREAAEFARRIVGRDRYGRVTVSRFKTVTYHEGLLGTYREYIGKPESVFKENL